EKLNRVDPDDVWVHPDDAVSRGIQDGQPVRVESAYGATILPVRVTEDIARGCVSMKEGRWFTPDADGVDREGAANSVTRDFSSACGATTYNTAFVEVRPVNPGPM
ncbi:MAG: molybdopterin dinucleotide binding domain-containing protein, partial [Pseudomonadota bacterium]|nr:molybdopterin dinucleotide binding domain-containing protein [Pseudomonadota bacterium]